MTSKPCPRRCPNLMPCPKHGYTVVTGPPCSGKTTYILEHMAEGDVMVDFDRIAQAISPKSPQYQYPEGVRRSVRALNGNATAAPLTSTFFCKSSAPSISSPIKLCLPGT